MDHADLDGCMTGTPAPYCMSVMMYIIYAYISLNEVNDVTDIAIAVIVFNVVLKD